MGTPAICCHNLTKHFGSTRVIDDLTLCVDQGEFVALLGASGCGKTSTLRMIAGFERPDDGIIEIAGRLAASSTVSVPPEHRRVGMVFQEYALFPHLNVKRNVEYGLQADSFREYRVQEVLELVGLTGLGKRMPHELSGGQQQRVALARALAPRPDVVLLDEPFSNLDAGLRVRLRQEVRDILKHAGTTAIFVTHDQEEALSLADRVAVMQGGKILQVAPPDALYRLPASRVVAAFVGDANFIPGEANGMTVMCGLGKLPLPLCRPAHGAVDVMVRPEWIDATASPNGDAVVISRTYFGHDQMMKVRTNQGVELQVRLGTYRMFEPGDRVALAITCPVVAYSTQTGQNVSHLSLDLTEGGIQSHPFNNGLTAPDK
jgi:iron(III) transport system ATP-binding protein